MENSLAVYGFSTKYKNIESCYKEWNNVFDNSKKAMPLQIYGETFMNNIGKRNPIITFLIITLVILFSSAFAIAVHAIMPAAVDVTEFDGTLVKMFGFPAVAVSYFFILYIQCTMAVRFVCKRTKISNMQTGIRLGLSFALIYLIAMQEVVIKGSPFDTYGIDFIRYQFFMGLGDAIPAFLLCMIITVFTIKNIKDSGNGVDQVGKQKIQERIRAIGIIAICFFIERVIGYKTGIIQSDCDTYPIPSYIWTALFGLTLGCIYIILYPVLFNEDRKSSVAVSFIIVIGINWVIFNSFIGLILDGVMPQMFLRSGIDVIILLIACCVTEKLTKKSYSKKHGIGGIEL